jgi:hypothetical protein
MNIDLSQIVVKDQKKATNVIYDKDWKVSFDLMYLSKTELQALIGKHTKIDFNKKTHQKEEVINTETLNEEIAETCIKGWHGVNLKWLSTVLVLDTSKAGNLEEDVDFNKKNLMIVVKNVYGFDNWLIDTIKDASNFSEKKAEEAKN